MIKAEPKFKETEIGTIPDEWSVGCIADLVRVTAGYAIKSGDFTTSGVGVLKIKNINERVVDVQNTDKISEDSFKRLRDDFVLSSGDIIVAMTGATIGKVGKIRNTNNRFALNQRVARFIAKNSDDLEFVFQYSGTKNFIDAINNYANGAAQQNISAEDIASIALPIPPHHEREQIAEILSSLDDKIELNRQMNITLEKIAAAIFKKWFVDVGDELPEGWRVANLREFIDLDRGLSYKGKNLCSDGIPMLNLGTFDIAGGIKFEGLKHYNGIYKEKNLVHPGDIVIANTDITQSRDILGRAVMVPDNFFANDILFTHHVYAIRFHKNISHNFVRFLLTSPAFKSNAITYATGTTVLFLPKEAVLEYKFILPNDQKQNEFEEFAEGLRKKIESNNDEIFNLMKIRDSLLPRLMSGKIRVNL